MLALRSPIEEIDALLGGGYPFFRAGWSANVVCMALGGHVDWTEVAESYCLLAPKNLVALVQPAGSPGPHARGRIRTARSWEAG